MGMHVEIVRALAMREMDDDTRLSQHNGETQWTARLR
jgi:hypothetical protein